MIILQKLWQIKEQGIKKALDDSHIQVQEEYEEKIKQIIKRL